MNMFVYIKNDIFEKDEENIFLFLGEFDIIVMIGEIGGNMNNKGQALVEFVLILPVFIFILFAVVDFGIAGALVGLGTLRNVIMIGIVVKIVQTVMNILIGIIFKAAGDIFMEMDPILPVQEEYPDANEICHILVEIGMIQLTELLRIFLFLANHLLQKLHSTLGAVAIGMDTGSFNVVQVFIDKGLADLPEGAFNLAVFLFCKLIRQTGGKRHTQHHNNQKYGENKGVEIIG